MKKGDSIIGVRSETLHARITNYVGAVSDDNVTKSSVVRAALKEYLDRKEAEFPSMVEKNKPTPSTPVPEDNKKRLEKIEAQAQKSKAALRKKR